jgi:hypothetical protein
MCAVEEIPNADLISRLIEIPKTYERERGQILETVFEFPNGDGESVVWRKYARTDDDVHHFGRLWETAKRKREEERHQRESQMRYVGFAQNVTEVVREFRTARGHGFKVFHVPKEGIQHAEVSYDPRDGQQFIRTDRAELKLAIAKMFSVLIPCPAIA